MSTTRLALIGADTIGKTHIERHPEFSHEESRVHMAATLKD